MNRLLILILFPAAIISLIFNIFFYFKLRREIVYQKNKTINQIKVTKIIDGDTFDIEDGERIRLYGVNAPEYPKGCLGIEAKVRLEDLILGKMIEVEKIKKDNFGRELAWVYLDDLLVNQLLVEEGLAYFEKDKSESSYLLEIEKTEEKAKLVGRGVWSPLCQTKKEGCLIKGNYREGEHTRIYHTPECYNYDRITIKPGTSDRWFCNEEEATKAGFRKSKDCPL